MRTLSWVIVLMLALLLMGCASGGEYKPPAPTPIPADCKDSILWNIKGDNGVAFMPYGPDSLTAAMDIAMIAKPEIQPKVKAAAVKAYYATNANTLPQVIRQFKNELGDAALYTSAGLRLLRPFIDLPAVNVPLTPCDKKILRQMFKDVAMDAGAKEEVFK